MISGRAAALDAVVRAFARSGSQRPAPVTVSHAFHSPLIDSDARRARPASPRRVSFRNAAAAADLERHRTAWRSRRAVDAPTTGAATSASRCSSAERFADLTLGHRRLHRDRAEPGPARPGHGAACRPTAVASWLPSLRKGQRRLGRRCSHAGARCTSSGAAVDWAGFDRPLRARNASRCRRTPFERERHWVATRAATVPRPGARPGASAARPPAPVTVLRPRSSKNRSRRTRTRGCSTTRSTGSRFCRGGFIEVALAASGVSGAGTPCGKKSSCIRPRARRHGPVTLQAVVGADGAGGAAADLRPRH